MSFTPRGIRYLDLGLILGGPVAFGLLGVLLGKDANWDFLNYHWYNPYAFLRERLGFDLAVAHHATFYNPLLDVPFFLVAQSQPAWVAGFLLSTVQGCNFSLLYCLARTMVVLKDARWRRCLAVAIAVSGMTGAGALGQLGLASYDTVVSIGVLAMLLLVTRRHREIFHGPVRPAVSWAGLAGCVAGVTVGLKLTAAVYALGFCLAFLLTAGRPLRRVTLALVFGLGTTAGFAAFALPWMVRLWHYTGNPLFPYFNQVFHSPLIVTASYRDTRFIPTDLIERLFFPLFFSFNPSHVAEFPFRDVHILFAYFLIPAGLLIPHLWRRKHFSPPMAAGPGLFIVIGSIISYVLWMHLFSVYRYIIAIEMLSPLLIALSLAQIPFSTRHWLTATGLLLVLSAALVSVSFDRLAWDERYVEVNLPAIPRPSETMILMTGYAPMAYVIPSFPPEIPFIRIHGLLVGPDGQETGYTKEMRQRVGAHRGDLYAMFHPSEQKQAQWALAAYGLELEMTACSRVTANVGEPLAFREARRPSGAEADP